MVVRRQSYPSPCGLPSPLPQELFQYLYFSCNTASSLSKSTTVVLHYLCEASGEEQDMYVLYTHTHRVAKFPYLILSAIWKQLLLVWVKHVNALNHEKEALTFQIIVIFPFPSSCITQSGLYIWDPAVLAWICDTQTVLWSYFCPEITLCISITSCREELIK